MIMIKKQPMRYEYRILAATTMLIVFVPSLLLPMLIDLPLSAIVIVSIVAVMFFLVNAARMTYYITEIKKYNEKAIIRYVRFNREYESIVSEWSRQVKIVQQFSKYPSFVLHIQTDDGQVIRQHEVLSWSIADFDQLYGKATSSRYRLTKLFAVVVISIVFLLSMYGRCTSDQKASVCESTWQLYERKLNGVVRVSWPVPESGSDRVWTVIDHFTGDSVEMRSIEFISVASDGDSVSKEASDVCFLVHKRDTTLMVDGIQLSTMCVEAWRHRHPERLEAIQSAKLKSISMPQPK
jgi:hypothetical protein